MAAAVRDGSDDEPPTDLHWSISIMMYHSYLIDFARTTLSSEANSASWRGVTGPPFVMWLFLTGRVLCRRARLPTSSEGFRTIQVRPKDVSLDWRHSHGCCMPELEQGGHDGPDHRIDDCGGGRRVSSLRGVRNQHSQAASLNAPSSEPGRFFPAVAKMISATHRDHCGSLCDLGAGAIGSTTPEVQTESLSSVCSRG
jgi:hypothetical protein